MILFFLLRDLAILSSDYRVFRLFRFDRTPPRASLSREKSASAASIPMFGAV